MKTYTVVGTLPVLGHQPGETFEGEINEWQEGRLIGSGAIRVEGAVEATDNETPDALKELLALTREALDVLGVECGLDPKDFGNKAELAEAIASAATVEATDNETPDASGNDE